MMTLRRLTLATVLVTLSLLLSMPGNAHANSNVFYVAPSPPGTGTSGGSCSAPGFNTIQSAVNAAPPNSLIIVCPGTYTEQVTVTKTLALKGSGPSITTVKAPAALVQDAFLQKNIVTITGSGITVSVSGFTISGPGLGPCGSINYGIFVSGGANAYIVGNSIVSIRDNPLSGCQNGGGIRVGSRFLGTTGTATIASNSISDYQKSGIVVDNAGSSANIYGNTVKGVGPTPMIAQNGIQVSRGGKATVSHNSVSGNECDHPVCGPDLDVQTQSAGILLYNDVLGPLAATVSDNNVFGNDIGVLPFSVTGTSLTGNRITDNRDANMALYFSNNNLIDGNTISVSNANAAGAPCTVAVSFCFPHRYTLGIDILDSSNGNSVSQNSVTVTADHYAILLDSSTSGNSVTCNNLSANHGATTGDAAVQDLGTGNTKSNSCCVEEDGNGNFQGQQQGNFQMDNDGCMDGDQNQVSSTNVGDGKTFQSTSISTTSLNTLAHTVTITGLGTHGGVPVAFTFVALETGPTTPGWVSFAFSDGYTNAGTLISGSILLH
jgi:nitrous oxidase accessory protein NosD